MYNNYQGSYPVYSYTTYDDNNLYNYGYQGSSGDRRFFGPFILGGITGGLLAPTFYRPYPYYYPY